MARYELWYADVLGNKLAYINDIISFEYAKVLGDIGVGVFQFPRRGQVYDNDKVDRRIHVYRQPKGGVLKLDFTCYLRKFATNTTLQGQKWLEATGFDQNEILARRIVAEYAEAQETVADNEYIDDLMKRIYHQNFGDSALSHREIDDYGFTKAADSSLGPQVTRAFAWRNVLAVLQDLQADSKAAGNEVFFGLVGVSETAMQFRTWINQPGANLTGDVIFSLENGNLSNPRLTHDYSEEANYIYAGGQGQQSARIVEEVSDADRIARSPLNLREKFRHSQHGTIARVTGDGYAELELSRPRITFSADIHDAPHSRYGKDWKVGDRVTVAYAGYQFDTLIRAIKVRVDPNGKESIGTRVEYVG